MTDFPFRPFADDVAVTRLGEGLLSRTLPRVEWTHEAHLAACVWLLLRRPDIGLETDIDRIIAGYNASVGGMNDDHGGYHDTITRAYLAGIRTFLFGSTGGLAETVNALLASDVGSRDWPLRYYSRERLFSVEARRGFVEPDIAPLPVIACDQD